jgi:hypothetical protein
MILPNVFDGRDGFVRRHGIKTSRHSFTLGWELTRKSVLILDWHFGNSTCTGKVIKFTTFPALIRQT